MNYIKYAFIGIAIIISSIVIGYIITNERKVADLKLENQQVAISNETNKTSLEVQKEITKIHTRQVKNNTALQNRFKNATQGNLDEYKCYTTQELINYKNCLYREFNNIDVICTK